MPGILNRRANISLSLLAFAGIFTGLYFLGSWHMLPAQAPLALTKPQTPAALTSAPPAAGLLALIGLEPRALAAAGCSAEVVSTIGGHGLTYVHDHGTDILASVNTAKDAAKAVNVLETKVRSGQNSSEMLQQLATARTNAQNATNQRDSDLAGLRNAALDSVDSGIIDRLTVMHTRRYLHLPPEYCVCERTQDQAAAIVSALSVKRTADRKGTSVPAGAASVLEAAEQDSATSTAKSAVASNLTAVASAWNTALHPQ